MTKHTNVIKHYPTGELWYMVWYLDGCWHRTDGPARIVYTPSGKFRSIEWWLNGKLIFPENWLEENGYEWPLTKEQETEFLLVFG